MIVCGKYELLQILYCCCCHPAVSILTAAAACTAESHFLGAAVAFVERLAAMICMLQLHCVFDLAAHSSIWTSGELYLVDTGIVPYNQHRVAVSSLSGELHLDRLIRLYMFNNHAQPRT